MYNINTSIPGWTSEAKLLLLASLADKVKETGWIVEIGCYVGRSTHALGMNKSDSVLLTCIDPWPTKRFLSRPLRKDVIGSPEEGDAYNYETWNKYTQDIKNIESYRMWMPLSTTGSLQFNRKADLVFLDGGHTNEETYNNIVDWYGTRLNSGGKLVIDDYLDSNWCGVTQAVNRFTKENNIKFDFSSEDTYCILER